MNWLSDRREDDSSLDDSSLDDRVSEGIYAGIYGRYQPGNVEKVRIL